MRGEFAERVVYWDGTDNVPFKAADSRQEVKWSELSAKVLGLQAQEPVGIRFLYGLNDVDPKEPKLVWALQPMLLVQESVVFHTASTIDDGIWVVASDGSLSVSDTTAWQLGPQAKYLANVRLQRDSTSKHVPLVPEEDPQSYTFFWDDLMDLYMSNDMPELIRINAIASPNVRRAVGSTWYEADWVHRLALSAVDGQAMDILSDDPSTGLKDRALEMATPCPPRCRKVLKHEYGQMPHSACTCP